jgi:hypothetical protein
MSIKMYTFLRHCYIRALNKQFVTKICSLFIYCITKIRHKFTLRSYICGQIRKFYAKVLT